MKTKRTVIAACIATLFFSGTVFAKDSWNYHENEWNNVKSYGKVAIAQDSVEQWGPWEDFAEPAAGLIAPANLLGFAKNEPYRNNPDVNPTPQPTNGCAAGTWCGYAIFKNKTSGSTLPSLFSYEGGKGKSQYSAALFSLIPNPETTPIPKGGVGGDASWSLVSLSDTVPNFDSSGTPIPVYFGGGSHGRFYDNRDNEIHHFMTVSEHGDYLYLPQNSDTASISGFSHNLFANEARSSVAPGYPGYPGYFEQAITGGLALVNIDGNYRLVWLKPDNDVAVGTFERTTVEREVIDREEIAAYTRGYNSEFGTTTVTTKGYYVAGIATPQSYLDAQRAGDVRATYVGGSFDGSQQGKVNITVNFRPGTWTGNWSQNGGFDFNAAGTVSGANISGGVVNTPNMNGTVNGTFYGQQAGSIGGVTDVTKTTYKGTQSQAAVFLVNKVPTAPPK